MRKIIITIGIMSGLSALVFGLYKFYSYQISQALTYCYKLTRLKFNKIDTNRINLDLFLKVRNNSDFIVDLNGYSFEISINEKVVGKAESTMPVTVKNNGVTELGVNLNFDPIQMFDLAYVIKLISYALDDKTKFIIKVKGVLHAKMQFIPISMPINITMNLAEITAPEDPNNPKQVCNI
jgi:LEA14-like dessication related protein